MRLTEGASEPGELTGATLRRTRWPWRESGLSPGAAGGTRGRLQLRKTLEDESTPGTGCGHCPETASRSQLLPSSRKRWRKLCQGEPSFQGAVCPRSGDGAAALMGTGAWHGLGPS